MQRLVPLLVALLGVLAQASPAPVPVAAPTPSPTTTTPPAVPAEAAQQPQRTLVGGVLHGLLGWGS